MNTTCRGELRWKVGISTNSGLRLLSPKDKKKEMNFSEKSLSRRQRRTTARSIGSNTAFTLITRLNTVCRGISKRRFLWKPRTQDVSAADLYSLRASNNSFSYPLLMYHTVPLANWGNYVQGAMKWTATLRASEYPWRQEYIRLNIGAPAAQAGVFQGLVLVNFDV